MPRTFLRQDLQISSTGQSTLGYVDNTAPTEANYETNPTLLAEDLNNLRSAINYARKADLSLNWWDAQTAPTTLETGVVRGIDDLNDGLHAIEKKRVLRDVHNLTDVTVGAGNNFVILGTGELPAQTTAAVGAVTTLGTVVAAHGGTFGTHSLAEVAGNSAVNPQNLMAIVDGATRDPILSGGRTVHGLLHGESGVTDGATITDTTTTRVQISFVRLTAAGDDLEAVPFADIENAVINYCTRERVRLEDLNEQDFLTGAVVDVGAGAGTIDRQTAYTNQGVTPVDLTTNATLDLEGAGLTWAIRDDLEASLFSIVEGSAGGTSQVNIHSDVDEYDNDAAVVDFANGATLNSGGTRPIEVGVTDGLLRSTAGDLEVRGTGELLLNDGNLIGEGTWTGPGVKLTDTAAEITTYEANFGGEVSLFNAINQAYSSATARRRVQAVVTSAIAANTDASGPSNDNNLDVDLGDLSAGTFVTDYDVFVNGQLVRNGANAAANEDVYPGTALANGQLRFEFALQAAPGNADTITIIDWAA